MASSLPFDFETDSCSQSERRSYLRDEFEKGLKKNDSAFAACKGVHNPMRSVDDNGADPPVFAVRFATQNHSVLASADESGYIHLLDYTQCTDPDSELKTPMSCKRSWNGHGNAVFDLKWSCDDKFLASCSGDKKIKIWDTETGAMSRRFSGHTGSVKSIDFMNRNPNVLVSGGRDGKVMVWDLRAGDSGQGSQDSNSPSPRSGSQKRKSQSQESLGNPVLSWDVNPQKNRSSSITCAKFFPDDTLVATSESANGSINYWDIRSRSVNQIMLLSGKSKGVGTNSMDVSQDCTKLLVSTTRNQIRIYSCLNPGSKRAVVYSKNIHISYYVKSCFSPCGRYFVTGSVDPVAYIFDTWSPSKAPIALQGHSSDVNGVHWRGNLICTSSDDGTVRLWEQRSMRSELPSEEEKESGESDSHTIYSSQPKVSWNGDSADEDDAFGAKRKKIRRTIHYYLKPERRDKSANG